MSWLSQLHSWRKFPYLGKNDAGIVDQDCPTEIKEKKEEFEAAKMGWILGKWKL